MMERATRGNKSLQQGASEQLIKALFLKAPHWDGNILNLKIISEQIESHRIKNREPFLLL